MKYLLNFMGFFLTLICIQGCGSSETVKDICVVRPIPLTTNIDKVDFMPDNFTKSQLITISNPTDEPIPIGKLFVDGQDGNRFLLQSKTVISLNPGMQQPSEDISGTTIPAHSDASFRVAISNPVQENLIATIHIPSKGCELKIPVREFNSTVQ
jgi:hypothetical protein